jgi:hypothetical protein
MVSYGRYDFLGALAPSNKLVLPVEEREATQSMQATDLDGYMLQGKALRKHGPVIFQILG